VSISLSPAILELLKNSDDLMPAIAQDSLSRLKQVSQHTSVARVISSGKKAKHQAIYRKLSPYPSIAMGMQFCFKLSKKAPLATQENLPASIAKFIQPKTRTINS
jgi:hypothetical protein